MVNRKPARANREPVNSGGCPFDMSPHDDKRRLRKLKRDIKRAGNRKRRQHLKRSLSTDPETAAAAEFEFGRDSSRFLNGGDRDATRRRDLPAD